MSLESACGVVDLAGTARFGVLSGWQFLAITVALGCWWKIVRVVGEAISELSLVAGDMEYWRGSMPYLVLLSACMLVLHR